MTEDVLERPKQLILLISGDKYIGFIRGQDETSMTVTTNEGDVEIFMHAIASIEPNDQVIARQLTHLKTIFIPYPMRRR